MRTNSQGTFDYKKLFAHLPTAHIIFAVDDPAFTILEENEAHTKVAMMKREDVVGKSFLEAFPDTSESYKKTGVSKPIESIRRALVTKQPDTMPRLKYDLKDESGTLVEKYWQATHYPLFDDEGEVIAILQNTEDITKEVLAANKLEELELALRQALAIGRICTWNWDMKNNKVYGDQNLAYLFGCSKEEAEQGMSIEKFVSSIHPEDQSAVQRKIAETIKSNTPYEAEYRTISQDGSMRWVLARGQLRADSTGEYTRFPGAIIDITDRKITENNLTYLVNASKALSSSLEYEVTLQRAAELAIPTIADWCTIDLLAEDGQIKTVALAHKDPKKIAWANAHREKTGPIDPSEPTGVANVLRTGEPELYAHIPQEVLAASAKDEEHLALLKQLGMSSVMMVPLKIDGRTVGCMTLISTELMRHYAQTDLEVAQEVAARASMAIANSYAYDVSQKALAEKTRLEKQLASANARLEVRVAERTKALNKTNTDLLRSNRELENFAYVASHDLQEPLRKIQAFGNLLEEEVGDKLGEGADYLARMRSAAERMSALINDLLTFSRVATKKEPIKDVALSKVVEGVLSDLEDQIKRTNGRVEVGELPTIMADELQMRQLFQNLIGNALKFHQKDAEPVVTIASRALERDGGYEITVSDNGVGFDEKYLDRIFAVFQRLNGRNEFEGTGIGLAVCRKIVERHGGTITARSTPGDGATFIVTLPKPTLKKGELL